MKLLGKRLAVFGCGYIGGCVARQAIEKGMTVVALTRNSETATLLANDGMEVVVGDLASGDWHRRIPGPVDFVLNTVSAGGGGIEGYRHSYLDGMASLLRWAAGAAPIDTVVYTSSTSVYPQDGGALVDESADTAGASERGQILRAAEDLLNAAGGSPAGALFKRSFILRLAGIYGPTRRHLVDQVLSGEVAGRGDHHLNLIHRDDVCSAIWAAFAAPSTVGSETFNVADGAAARKAEIVAWLAGELGVPEPRFTGAPAGTRRTVTPDRVILNRKLKDMLGWQPQFADFRSGYKNRLALDAD